MQGVNGRFLQASDAGQVGLVVTSGLQKFDIFAETLKRSSHLKKRLDFIFLCARYRKKYKLTSTSHVPMPRQINKNKERYFHS